MPSSVVVCLRYSLGGTEKGENETERGEKNERGRRETQSKGRLRSQM